MVLNCSLGHLDIGSLRLLRPTNVCDRFPSTTWKHEFQAPENSIIVEVQNQCASALPFDVDPMRELALFLSARIEYFDLVVVPGIETAPFGWFQQSDLDRFQEPTPEPHS